MDQNQIPLYEALLRHIQQKPISFHVPGHKNGQVFPTEAAVFFQPLLQMDATEITGLDDLHSPEGPILEAERLLADLYQAKESFFLVNGSTAGNLAMIMAACEENQVVLVQRNCHKSVLNAIQLAKADPVFLEPEYDANWKMASSVHYDTVKEAIRLYPEAKALILTYPNYYGIAYDIKSMIELAHGYDIPVLVDEAHGAHFMIGSPFPMSSVALGADIIVQSAHKTLPAMTMGSYLHFNSKLINVNKVKNYLHIFQSSSPSYPIMASLDIARSYLADYDSHDLSYLLNVLNEFKKGLNNIPGIRVLDYPNIGDPLKITIQSACGLSGFQLQKIIEDAGIFAELADPYNVLLVFPLLKETQPYRFHEALAKIRTALKDVSSQAPAEQKRKQKVFKPHSKISRLAVSFQEMNKRKEENIFISEASGKIAAETVIPYPPGIPLLLKGELITEDKLERLKQLIADNARFQGGSLLKQNMLKVFGG